MIAGVASYDYFGENFVRRIAPRFLVRRAYIGATGGLGGRPSGDPSGVVSRVHR